MSSPLYTFQNPIVWSPDPDAKKFPSSENTMLVTKLEWPLRIFYCLPLDISHILIVLSDDPDAKYFPSTENATLFTADE